MKNKSKVFLGICLFFAAQLACRTVESVATIPSSQSAVTEIPTALPAEPPKPPLGLFTGSVAFTTIVDAGIYTINMQTGETLPMMREDLVATFLARSADGNRVVYWHEKGLTVFDHESGQSWQFAENFHLSGDGFTFNKLLISADGEFVVFDDDGPVSDGLLDIFRADLDSGEIVNLTPNSRFNDRDPVLSPDGTHIAFASATLESNTESIWMMNAEGGDLVNLTPNDEFRWKDYLPEWSPDGAQVAFFRSYIGCSQCDAKDPTPGTPGWPPGLWAVNANGTGETLIKEYSPANAPIKSYTEIAWSPDGKHIAYYSYGGTESKVEGQVWVVEVATGESSQLMNITAGHFHAFSSISWSPDSQAILVIHDDESNGSRARTVYVAATDGSGVWPLFEINSARNARWLP